MTNLKRPRGLIISPYHARSHAIWAEEFDRIVDFIDWKLLSLPPRFFSWRVRGNPLALLFDADYAPEFNDIDLLVATSMTDLATLRGLCRRLDDVPCVYYFHENQYAYPRNDVADRSAHLEAKMVSLYGALCADHVVFNSLFNRDTFLAGAREMLARFPDHAPLHCIDSIADKCSVIPVPLTSSLEAFAPSTSPASAHDGQERSLKIAWNHRWEYDKRPDQLARIIALVADQGLDCRFYIFGQVFRDVPEVFQGLQERYPKQIAHMGNIAEPQAYYQALACCDVVLSTAAHDFQGLAVLEGIQCNCVPVVPDRLAYQEYLPDSFRYSSLLQDPAAEAQAAVEMLKYRLEQLKSGALSKPPTVSQLDRSVLSTRYTELCRRLLVNGQHRRDGDNM